MTNAQPSAPSAWQTLIEVYLAGQPGVDQLAWNYVAGVVRSFNLAPADLERLQTTIVETMLKAIEPSPNYRSDLPVPIRLRASYKILTEPTSAQKDVSGLIANMPAQESLRGWGFFLIERVVDNSQTPLENSTHSIELFLYRE